MQKNLAFIFTFVLPLIGYGQILHFGLADWKFEKSTFHLAEIIDSRKDPANAGKSIVGNKKTDIRFEQSAEVSIANYLSKSFNNDTFNTFPLTLEIKKLNITNLLIGKRHKVSADMLFCIKRNLAGKSYDLYEFSLRPVAYKTNPLPTGSLEEMITASLKELFKQFDRWAQTQHSHPLLVRITSLVSDGGVVKNDPDTIHWSKNYKLSWEDFKGKDLINSPFSAQSNCLYTLEQRPIFNKDSLTIHVMLRPCFTRKSSWVHPDALQDTLLMHEQLHFDLCELYGRIFRKNIAGLTINAMNFDKEISQVFNEMWTQYSAEQEKYDLETNHGTITEMQIKWIRETEKRLNELSDWER